jgi:hypothetical protein
LEDLSTIHHTYVFFSVFFTGICSCLWWTNLVASHEFFLRQASACRSNVLQNARFKLPLAATVESEPSLLRLSPQHQSAEIRLKYRPLPRFVPGGHAAKVPERYNNNGNISQIKAFPSFGLPCSCFNASWICWQEQSNKHFELLQEQTHACFWSRPLRFKTQVQNQQLPNTDRQHVSWVQQLMQMQMQPWDAF